MNEFIHAHLPMVVLALLTFTTIVTFFCGVLVGRAFEREDQKLKELAESLGIKCGSFIGRRVR